MSAQSQKLRAKLAELFQFDAAAELDFGIYRILNARRVEVGRFLDGLQPEVEAIIKSLLADKSSTAQAEAEKLKAQLVAAEVDPATNPKFLRLMEEAARAGGNTFELENEIFSHLATFFSRYYKDGDFLSLRRYKRDTCAIPYEGEEVKLHWANADQFYIKSAENFRDYTFRLGPAPKDGAADARPRVTFKLTEADTERDNNKAVAGKERRFIHTGVVGQTTEALVLGFEYRALGESDDAPGEEAGAESGEATAAGKKKKAKDQATLNREAVQKILAECARGPFAEIAALRPTEKNKQRSLLEKHLADYTARNTFDYFIHKDLGGFLRRELDFFIKNEVLHLDDLEAAPEADWRQQQARLRAIRAIAHRVIRFLAQIEDFQKKLWLKKKFVTRCDYLITLDRLPAALLQEVAASAAQREEWVRLLALNEIAADLGRTGYSEPLTVEFLKENLSLPLDTRNFGEEFRRKVMAGIENEGATLGGTVIQSENANGMSFITTREKGSIDACYFDPPYNTGNNGFAYKDSFQSSSWLAMIQERLFALRQLVRESGSIWASIDDREVCNLRWAMTRALPSESFVSDIALVNNFKGRQDRDHVATAHEHLLLFAMPDFDSNGFPLTDDQVEAYSEEDERGEKYQLRDLRKRGGNDSRELRPQLYFPLFWDEGGKRMTLERNSPSDVEILPKRSDGSDGCWRWGVATVRKNLEIIEGIQVRETGRWNASYRVYLETDGEERTSKPKSVWFGSKYSSDRGIKELRKTLPDVSFVGPKSPELIRDILLHATTPGDTILDFFAGSGTTGHAVISQNREDNGTRKYVLVEMGEHFDTVLVPRLKKVIYAKDWKEGKPQSRNTGVSHACKVLRLESYEDTLNNLRLPARRPEAQELALQAASPAVREEYTLGYMLELETQGSPSLLNVSAFTDPFSYTLQTATGTAGETRPVNVDLVETFNWLLGLTVRHTDFIREVCVVDGTNPQGERVLILWRNTAKVEAEALNEWFTKQGYSTRDLEYAVIYVNGDHHLENLRRDDQSWKVRMIDE